MLLMIDPNAQRLEAQIEQAEHQVEVLYAKASWDKSDELKSKAKVKIAEAKEALADARQKGQDISDEIREGFGNLVEDVKDLFRREK